MTNLYIPFPEPKTSTVNVPHRSGVMDLTEVMGFVPYQDRKGIKLEFIAYCKSYVDWNVLLHRLADICHGKSVKMICDNDSGHYYMVRLKVDSTKGNNNNCKITLSGTSEPFKYDLQSTNEPWLWDPFDFETGVIQSTENLYVDASHPVTLVAAGQPTIPEFLVNQTYGLKMYYGGKTYEMNVLGKYRFPQIKVGSENATFYFSGSGKISIIYRGRYL